MSELPKGPLTREFWEIPETVEDPQWAGRRLVSEATRRVAHKVVVTFAPPEVLDRAAALINEAAALLEGHPEWTVKQAYEGGQLSQSPQQYADRQSIIGRANPFAPPLRLRREGDEVIGEVVFEHAHGGAPGWVHGGLVATIFDQAMGYVLITNGYPCVTASMEVKFEKPTRLHTGLVLRAREVGREGNRVKIHADLWDGELRLAQSWGEFVQLDAARFRKIALQQKES